MPTTLSITLTDDLIDILSKEATGLYGTPDLRLRVHHILLEAAMTSTQGKVDPSLFAARLLTEWSGSPVEPPLEPVRKPDPAQAKQQVKPLRAPVRSSYGNHTSKYQVWAYLVTQNLNAVGRWTVFSIKDVMAGMGVEDYKIAEAGMRQLRDEGWLVQFGTAARSTAAKRYTFSREARLFLLQPSTQSLLLSQGIVYEGYHPPRDINDNDVPVGK